MTVMRGALMASGEYPHFRTLPMIYREAFIKGGHGISPVSFPSYSMEVILIYLDEINGV